MTNYIDPRDPPGDDSTSHSELFLFLHVALKFIASISWSFANV
jgi:hypothetical protein